MSKKNTMIATGVGLVLVAGVGGAALAANNDVASSNAGQGTGEVAGFTITNVEYHTENLDTDTAEPTVGRVTFDISRDAPGSAVVDSANTHVSVQLRDDDGADADWAFCGVEQGKAICPLVMSNMTLTMAAVDDVSVVAYDFTPPPLPLP